MENWKAKALGAAAIAALLAGALLWRQALIEDEKYRKQVARCIAEGGEPLLCEKGVDHGN